MALAVQKEDYERAGLIHEELERRKRLNAGHPGHRGPDRHPVGAATQRKSTAWHTVLGALGLQFALAILVLKVPFVKDVFTWVAELFVVLIGYTDRGTDFLLGSFGMEGQVDVSLENFAFRLLPTIVFFSAFSALLHHAGILPLFIVVRLADAPDPAPVGHREPAVAGTSSSDRPKAPCSSAPTSSA